MTGFLINEHSAEDFCNKILDIKANDEIRRQFIENALKKFKPNFL